MNDRDAMVEWKRVLLGLVRLRVDLVSGSLGLDPPISKDGDGDQI